jgi:N-sulfoglucosamine sulfohydrolase
MQGRAFLGKHRGDADDGVFLFADRFDEIYGMRRGWTDGRWKYIRRFTPHLPAAPYSFYQFSMPSWTAWRKAWREGKLEERHKRIWEAPQPVEELFDLEADPWEIQNLAADPAHAERLAAMRAQLKTTMSEVKDTGIIPEPMFAAMCAGRPVADFARSANFDHTGVLDLAFAATSGDPAEIGRLQEAMKSDDPVKRYWGLLGMLIRTRADDVAPLLGDGHPVIRVLAAETLHAAGRTDLADKALLEELGKNSDDLSTVHLLNAITRLGLSKEVPDEWIMKTLKERETNEYVRRFAQEIRDRKK